ncbi:hypothetical protein BJ742DRAFT_277642 [Cladochytrium replicatum]|nr:hypothetical protein BJ742DRAFT_277642 [Cladochytrium replicatum]
MDPTILTTLTLNAVGTGLTGMGLIVVLINLHGTQGYSQQLHIRYALYLIATCVGLLSNVMTITGTNNEHCSPIWSRLNNICWGFTKVFFSEVSLIRFEMVTPDYPFKIRAAVRVFTAIWYLAWLLVIQTQSGFLGCQMIYDLMPLYPIYSYQLLVDVVTSFRFLAVFYFLRWHRREINIVSLIVDLCVFATIVASLAEVIILLTELPQPLDKIDFQRILFSGSSNFVITGVLYCAMSVYGKLDKGSAGGPTSGSGSATSTQAAENFARRQSRKSGKGNDHALITVIQSTALVSTEGGDGMKI